MAIISAPLSEPITTTTWQPITGDNSSVTKLVARTRGGNAFRVSADVGGDSYFTIPFEREFEIDISSGAGVLFYAQSVGADDTLEVCLS